MSFLANSLVVVLAAVCVAPALAQIPDFVKLGEIVQRCRQETGATNEDIQSIFMRKVPETRSGQCMLACAGESLGLMHGGSLDTEGTLAMAGQLMKGRDQKIQDAIKSAILSCAEYSDTRRAQEALKPYHLFKPTLNGVKEDNLPQRPKQSMKTLHSKSQSHYSQPIHRVRRQSENQGNTLSNPSQPTPYYPQTQPQAYPNQYSNQQYPNQNNPLAQIGRVLDPLNPAYTYPYAQPYQQPYVQPVIVATPYAGVPVVPFRGKRSPQEVILTSTEITLPPEVAAQISERLRELLIALISSQDGLKLNSTEVTEKDAEIVESITSPPRKRRQSDKDEQQESPFTQLIDRVIHNGPIHNIVHDLRNRMPSATNGSTTAGTPTAE